MGRATWCCIASACLAIAACDSLGSQSAEGGSLEGETIDLVVPYDPGGGYDIYARMLAPYLEDCLDATIAVRNEPGAGGLLATTKTYVAPPDEPRILMTNTIGVVSAQMSEIEGVNFEAQNFSWIARVSAEPNVLAVAADSEFQTFDDILNADEPIRFVATGPGANEYVNAEVLPEIYEFPAETITGFESSTDAQAAVIAGDADAHILPLDSQLEGIQNGDLRPLLVISNHPSSTLPDVPTVSDYPAGAEDEPIVEGLIDLVETGRSLAGPPDMDSERLDTLREGVDCALANQDLRAEAEEQQRDIDPLSGPETVEAVERALDSPTEFQELVKETS
jgi:tripartite-type tricarboxylate transporter receptor subunit TctC